MFQDRLFTIKDPYLYIAWWSFVGAFIITAVITLLTKPEDPGKIRGLVYRGISKDERLQQAIEKEINEK